MEFKDIFYDLIIAGGSLGVGVASLIEFLKARFPQLHSGRTILLSVLCSILAAAGASYYTETFASAAMTDLLVLAGATWLASQGVNFAAFKKPQPVKGTDDDVIDIQINMHEPSEDDENGVG